MRSLWKPQWRAQGRWPESYDRMRESLISRHGRQGGMQAMVALLRMGREFGHTKLEAAVDQALELGSMDVAKIRHLVMTDELRYAVAEAVEIGALAAYERPLPTMAEYDQLFSMPAQPVQA